MARYWISTFALEIGIIPADGPAISPPSNPTRSYVRDNFRNWHIVGKEAFTSQAAALLAGERLRHEAIARHQLIIAAIMDREIAIHPQNPPVRPMLKWQENRPIIKELELALSKTLSA